MPPHCVIVLHPGNELLSTDNHESLLSHSPITSLPYQPLSFAALRRTSCLAAPRLSATTYDVLGSLSMSLRPRQVLAAERQDKTFAAERQTMDHGFPSCLSA